ncbi:collagen-like protein [bacterium]|nr:collagen-like protein [bacterium]
MKVEFNSQKGYSYNVYGTSDPAKKTGWKLLGGGDGTGENIVFFYRTETDQKVFFKVESEPSEPGEEPKPQESVQSIIPITGLPPAESSGTYSLGEAIGENEIGGVYRIGVSAGTDGVVIELPHPGLQEYRQKQIKLSIYRGGTGLGSGKVSLKVPTLAGDEYESRKLVDNGAKQITDEVIILPATGSKDGRKVIVDLFNDTAKTDGAAGGQWVVTTAAEAMKSTLAHRWEGTSLALQKSDGTWEDWVNLQGSQGIRGPEGPQGSAGPQGIAGPEGPQGLLGPKADRGPAGPQGSRGQKGERGLLGYKGDKGAKGDKGNPGVKGDKGNKGEKGDTGNVTINGGELSCCGEGLEGRLELFNQVNVNYKHFNLSKNAILYDYGRSSWDDHRCIDCSLYDILITTKWYEPEKRVFILIYAFYNVDSLEKPQTFLTLPTEIPDNYKGDINLNGNYSRNMSDIEFHHQYGSKYALLVYNHQELYVDGDGSLKRKFDWGDRTKHLHFWDYRNDLDLSKPLLTDQKLISNMRLYCTDCEILDGVRHNGPFLLTHILHEDNSFDFLIYTIK